MNVVPRSRGIKRSRTVSSGRKQRIPKTIKYNGEVGIVRTATAALSYTASTGFQLGAGTFSAVAFVFDPTGIVIYGSAIASATIAYDNIAEVSALWDRVMIDKVEISWESVNDKSSTAGALSAPSYLIGNDCNNGATGTSLAAIKQLGDCTTLLGSGPFKWTVRPKFQRLLYFTPTTSSYEPATGYVNSDTAIPHYATHLGVLNPGTVGATTVNFSFKMFLKCKDLK